MLSIDYDEQVQETMCVCVGGGAGRQHSGGIGISDSGSCCNSPKKDERSSTEEKSSKLCVL